MINDRLRTAATTQGVPLNSLRRQFVPECFLARVFALPDCQGILNGGTGLLVRMPGARYSRDLDLCHVVDGQELQTSIDELVAAGRPGPRDPFAFEITRRAGLTGNAEGDQLTVAATLGPVYEKFPIDVTSRLAFVGTIETRHKPLPVQIDDVDEPPPMRLYPIGDQVADKVAAMYETHNGHPSGRFHDLVDLALIATNLTLDTAELTASGGYLTEAPACHPRILLRHVTRPPLPPSWSLPD